MLKTEFHREGTFPRNPAVMKRLTSPLPAILVLTGFVIACWQTISEARDLFQLVDKDAVACVHAPQLDSQWGRLRESEFSSRLQQATFFQDWIQSPDYKQLELVKVAIEAASGKTLGQSRSELFGRDAVIAWYHTPGSKPDLARNSVVLLEVENPAAAESALATWSILERQRTETRTHRDVAYTHSVKASSDQNAGGFWYTILGNVFVVSARETHILRVIDFETDALDGTKAGGGTKSAAVGHPDCLAAHEPFAKAFARRSKNELAAAYVNPRILGSELGRSSQDLSIIESTLARCQWLTLSVSYDDSIELEFVADYDSNDTPAWWKQWLAIAGSGQPSPRTIPANSLFAMSGRVASLSVSEMIIKSLQSQNDLPKDLVRARRVVQGLLLGLDPVTDVLPEIGPAWTFSIEPRDPEISTSFPVDSLLAIELKPHPAGDEPSPVAALGNALHSGLEILAAVHNAHATGQKVSVVRQRNADGATIQYADPVAFFQPAFVISKGHLVLATSPELCETFMKSAESDRTNRQEPVVNSVPEVSKSQRIGNLQNVMANSVATRQILALHKDWFIKQAQRDKVPEADAQKRLKQLNEFLQLLDRAWLTANVDDSTFRIAAGIAADSPAVEGKLEK